jgi:5'-methylthioadenosine phosphorylase
LGVHVNFPSFYPPPPPPPFVPPTRKRRKLGTPLTPLTSTAAMSLRFASLRMSAFDLAVIGGASLLSSARLSPLRPAAFDTPFGQVRLFLSPPDRLVFVQRHLAAPDALYRPPHLVNFRAIVAALVSLRVPRVVSFCSVGALRKDIPPGSILVPDDFFQIDPPTLFDDSRGHVVPKIDPLLRAQVLACLRDGGVDVIDGGTYAQTRGPRFQTPSETRFLASVSHVAGMSGAHEATLCSEGGVPFCLVVCVDNFCDGVCEAPLRAEDFRAAVKDNMARVEGAVDLLITRFAPEAKGVPTVRERVDLVVTAGWVVVFDEGEGAEALTDTSVAVRDGRIVAVLPAREASLRFAPSERVELPNHILIPGLVNAHTHAAMTLLRYPPPSRSNPPPAAGTRTTSRLRAGSLRQSGPWRGRLWTTRLCPLAQPLRRRR